MRKLDNILAGYDITKCCAIAVEEAVKDGDTVSFDFNGQEIVVRPGDDGAVIAQNYLDECQRRHEEWLKTPKGIEYTEEVKAYEREMAKLDDKPAITEKDKDIISQWYVDTKEVRNTDDLKRFVDHLMNDYRHDYGTVCHALSASAVAACWAADGHAQGGITGFQAGVVMWEFMRNWNGIKFPSKLLQYKDMLYPQHEEKFEKTINKETWEWLKKEAVDKIITAKDGMVHPHVFAHWKSIVAGIVPFGYMVKD